MSVVHITAGQTLTPEYLETAWEELLDDPQYKASRNAVARNDVLTVVENRDVTQNFNHVYSNVVSKEGKCTTQKSSGRCWMFAMCNVMRVAMMKQYNLPDDFELSQGYLFYYDKLERGNFFLEGIIETIDEPASSRIVTHLCSDPLCDGGQWDMLVNIVQKYGVCPKAAFPETKCCVASRRMNQFLKNKLRQYACQIRAEHSSPTKTTVEDLRATKLVMMTEYHKILSTFFGQPPTTFNWSFRDSKKNYHTYNNLTPKTFYEQHVPFDVDGYVSLIHDPRNPYYKHYTVEHLGNVVGGFPIRYINVPIDVLRALTITSIDHDEPVWFGCDVGKSMQREKGILHEDMYDFESTFGTSFGMNKEERLVYGESLMTHAMVFTAYDRVQVSDVDAKSTSKNAKVLGGNGEGEDEEEKEKTTVAEDQKVVKWRVENSWGTDKGDKGYLGMSDGWYKEWVYQIACNKKYLDDSLLKILNQRPTKLPAWDPMGALAK